MPQRVDTCNSLSIMGSLTARGCGLSLVTIELFGSAIRRGRLKVVPVRPALPKHHLTIACRIDLGLASLKPFREAAHTLVGKALGRARP